MALWVRFEHAGGERFGLVDGGLVVVHAGDLFGSAVPTGEKLPLDGLRLLTPCVPSKLIGIWNNYRALAEKTGQAVPAEPLYFIKGANSYCHPEEVIPQPRAYEGRVVYEGELGVVIGRRCKAVSVEEAPGCIFGFTCVNDVTALDLIARDASFAQWTRAKSFDGFGPFGPGIATDLDPQALVVKTSINGRERQNYACSDMIFPPAELVSRISQDLTLLPGDVIACGTSLGVGPLRRGCQVDVAIDGIGTLCNRYE